MASNEPTWADRAAYKSRKFSVAWDDESWDEDPVLEDILEPSNKPFPRQATGNSGEGSQCNTAFKRPETVAAQADSEQSTEKESNSEFDRSIVSTGISTPTSSVKDDEHAGVNGYKAIVDDWGNYCRDDELWRLQSALGTVDWEGVKWETIQSKNNIRAAKEQQETPVVKFPPPGSRVPKGPRSNRNIYNINRGNLDHNNNNNRDKKNNHYRERKGMSRDVPRGKQIEKQPPSQVQVVKDSEVKSKQKAVDLQSAKMEPEKVLAVKASNPRSHNYFGLLHDVTKDGNLKSHAKGISEDLKSGSTDNTDKTATPITTEKKPRKRNRRKHKYINSRPKEVERLSEPEDIENPFKQEETSLATREQETELSVLGDDNSPGPSTNCSASTINIRLIVPIVVGIFIGYLLNL